VAGRADLRDRHHGADALARLRRVVAAGRLLRTWASEPRQSSARCRQPSTGRGRHLAVVYSHAEVRMARGSAAQPAAAGERVGTVVPIAKIGTDRHRLDSFTWLLSVNLGTTTPASRRIGATTSPYPSGFTHYRKTYATPYAPRRALAARSIPAQWFVPSLRMLLEPAAARTRVFYSGNDVYDPRTSASSPTSRSSTDGASSPSTRRARKRQLRSRGSCLRNRSPSRAEASSYRIPEDLRRRLRRDPGPERYPSRATGTAGRLRRGTTGPHRNERAGAHRRLFPETDAIDNGGTDHRPKPPGTPGRAQGRGCRKTVPLRRRRPAVPVGLREGIVQRQGVSTPFGVACGAYRSEPLPMLLLNRLVC